MDAEKTVDGLYIDPNNDNRTGHHIFKLKKKEYISVQREVTINNIKVTAIKQGVLNDNNQNSNNTVVTY